jgi:hypothetical protein
VGEDIGAGQTRQKLGQTRWWGGGWSEDRTREPVGEGVDCSLDKDRLAPCKP